MPSAVRRSRKTIGNFSIEKRQQTVAAIDEGDFDSERHENRSIFAADDAAADNGEALGNAVHLQKCVRIKGMDIVERDFRRAMGLRAGGDQNDFAAKTARSICAGHRNGVRVLERCLAANKLDVMQFEIFEDAAALHFDDFAFMAHEIVNG